eukprot:CAMPEP_0115856074 /NCGR_PEP_ID=MMETSP0287-20121206/14865_1 /TAXON_ID=412157 /ORGANISM="Chrysochromulina rotalis, Strain UIO044" /LENGTH=178 /DNA_ID=CAMNT_0003310237 /DNA_START=215 /DNA_END=751 /DNA_ORIENTATION=+
MHACAPAATPLSASARDLDAHAVMPHSPARPPPPSLGRDLGTACFAHAAAIWNVRQAVPEEGAKLYDDAHKDDHTQKLDGRSVALGSTSAQTSVAIAELTKMQAVAAARRVRHALQLPLGTHKEARRANGDDIAQSIVDGERSRLAMKQPLEEEHRAERDDTPDAEADPKAPQALLES